MMLGSRMVVGCVALLAFGCAGAEARIVCHEGYQVVGGREIATPYCDDNFLAEVARERGFAVTNEAIRNNPKLKQKVCRWIGSDNRVRHNCDTEGGFHGAW